MKRDTTVCIQWFDLRLVDPEVALTQLRDGHPHEGQRKGALSIYGMGRFPVTLYKEQWLKLLDMSTDIREFIAANEAQLKTKD